MIASMIKIQKRIVFTFCETTSAQVIIGTERYPDSAILINYYDDGYSQGYTQIKEAFRALVKDDSLQTFISEIDFRSSNGGNIIGYNLYVFDIRYQKNFKSAQPIKIEFTFLETFLMAFMVML